MPGFVSLVPGTVSWVLGFVFWISGFVFWMSAIVFWVSGIVFWVSVFGVSGLVCGLRAPQRKAEALRVSSTILQKRLKDSFRSNL